MDDVDLVRSRVDIVELINSYISLKKAGRNFKALCPFHSEKTPSFIVSPERQIFKCFGCGQGGSVFNFLMEYEKMTFGEALRFLADKVGVKLKSFKPSKDQQEKDKILQINHLASEFYNFILLNHKVGKKALEYLLKRNIKKPSIRLFKLGYAPEGWENLTRFLVYKKRYKPTDLLKAGLVIERRRTSTHASGRAGINYYDRFRGRIIFPLRDHRGNIVGFSGRIIKRQSDKQGGKYINIPETLVYHKRQALYGLYESKEEVKKKNQVIITEGEFDVISSHQVGVRNVAAIKGSALTEDHVGLVKRFCENLYLSLDEDTAGDAATRRGIEIADQAGLNIRVISLAYGKDADECIQKSAKLWKESIKRAVPIFDFYIRSAQKRFGTQTVEGKRKISNELTPILAKIKNEVMKDHYIKKLAKVLQVSEEAVAKEMVRKSKSTTRIMSATSIKGKKRIGEQETRRERLENYLLALVLANPDKTSEFIKELKTDLIKTLAFKKIFEKIKEDLEKDEKFDIKKFSQRLPEELLDSFDNAYLQDLEDFLDEEKKLVKEFENTKKEIEKLALKDRLKYLRERIKKAEGQPQKKQKEAGTQKEGLEKLREKFRKVSQEIGLLE